MRQSCLGALLLLLVGLAAPASGQTADLVGAAPRDATVDLGLRALDDHLTQLLGGELPPDVEVQSLFGLALDGPDSLDTRIEQLTNEVAAGREALERLRSQRDPVSRPRAPQAESADADASRMARPTAAGTREDSPLDHEVAAAALRLGVAEKRLRYLGLLRERLADMTDASRRVLPALAEPRENMRRHLAAIEALGQATLRLAGRLDDLAARSEGGRVVGFRAVQKELADELRAGAAAHRDQAERLARVADDHRELASAAEAEGRSTREAFFRSIPDPSGQAKMDALFTHHLENQRDYAKRNRDAPPAPGVERIEALTAEADGLVPAPKAVGTTEDARRAADAATEHRQAVEGLIVGEKAAVTGWSLAFENELVTVLADVASPEARARAYARSNEVFQDIRSELRLARDRISDGFEQQLEVAPAPTDLFRTARGRSVLTRVALIGLILAVWLGLRRQTPRLTVSLVRGLARLPLFSGRVGQLVRWSGLIQATLPTLLGLVAIHLSLALMDGSPFRQLVAAIAVPLVLYALGRQVIDGVTRRLTRGRPPLIELSPPTLVRVQRTYATLGLVIATAYILGGIARIAIGAGRVVTLLNLTMMAWVGVWAVWEAVRWRRPLAARWLAFVPADEDETPGLERRAALWMEQRPMGWVLSPVAFTRIVATPVVDAVRELARETDLVQSFRAWRLRRRSSHEAKAENGPRIPLPEAYLEGFPLHPILGEDTSLLIPREALVDDIVAQLASWRESRADGSVVVVGEKGIGKTTLAAQVSRRFRDIDVVQHTIRGKPTTRDKLAAALASALETRTGSDLAELAAELRDGPERVVVIDEAHNVFLRCVDGYAAYDALVELVNETSSNVFWVLVFNAFTWQFLNEARGRIHYFRKLVTVPAWSADELQSLIKLRNRATGFELDLRRGPAGRRKGRFRPARARRGSGRLLPTALGIERREPADRHAPLALLPDPGFGHGATRRHLP